MELTYPEMSMEEFGPAASIEQEKIDQMGEIEALLTEYEAKMTNYVMKPD